MTREMATYCTLMRILPKKKKRWREEEMADSIQVEELAIKKCPNRKQASPDMLTKSHEI